jgi:predicted Rossmann fold nucleotide-binding protein DprA/Smf involved in DNA uptake
MNMMSEDAKAILLLCGHLGGPSEAEPLEHRDYNQVVRWLVDRRLRPEDLLEPEHVPQLAKDTGLPEGRLSALLKRGVKLGFAVEKWNQSGIWVICRSDPDYPSRYKSHLKDKAPPVLFGAGERSLLSGGGLAIVGSRNVDAEGDAFARDVAAWCARGGMPVISGGARGVDQIAMSSALEAGGVVVGVLADTLLRQSVSRDARSALADGRLLLISPYHPEAGFSVGTAMGRNKLIYALADYGLVVSADYNKGGTWEGAREELKRSPGRPVFVRMTGTLPPGNRKLLDLGAVPFPGITQAATPETVFAQAAQTATYPEPTTELTLFDLPPVTGRAVAMVRESIPDLGIPVAVAATAPEAETAAASIYDAVLPIILNALAKPLTPAALAEHLDVTQTQMNAWLKRALAQKQVRKLNRPVRYVKAH